MNELLSSLNTAHRIDAGLEQIIETAIASLQDGQPLDVDRLAAAHPQYAEQLRELLPMVAMMVRLSAATTPVEARGQSARLSPDTQETGLAHEQQLGDFRIVCELGRGGMGVVYEAEQISLGRRVALKVLPFAAMLDRQQLARFKNEARAAATLDHPNIVAIHSVGCERSVHFYAMQLIEGRSLAEVIAHLKPGRHPSAKEAASIAAPSNHPTAGDTAKAALPTVHAHGSAAFLTYPRTGSREFYRSAARLGIQAAEALDHAHQHGILHRDIKPANLLVDDTGKLWVTDFGLARVETDAGMTLTGDLLGTLRYMSPEQALAKSTVTDHRTDIYSLGATLYELITLQPAFAETDRAKLLQQIAFEEPRPLRKIDGHIPAELETIVLKAMAKQREDRYQSAEQMADDLRAFLDNRPIKAQPPGLAHRAAKWSRRHQALISIASIALLLLSVMLAVSIVKVQSAKTHALAALEETADLLYTTDMTLAYRTYEKGWSDEVQTLLDRHRPAAGTPDRRGFEWFLLSSLVQPPASFTLSGHRGPVNELAVFPDRQRLASVGDDATLQIWDVRARRLLKTIVVCPDPLNSVAVSPDGRFVAVGSTSVYVIDLNGGGKVSNVHNSEHSVESLVFTPDGQRLAAGSRYDEVCLLSLDGKVIKRIPCTSRVESLEFVPRSPSLLVPNRRPLANSKVLGFVQVWDDTLSDLQLELDATQDGAAGAITVARCSPCGRFVAAGERYRARAFVFDRTTGRILMKTPAARDRLNDLAYSPDGKSLVVGYQNGRLEYFGLQLDVDGIPSFDGRPLVVDAHRGEVTCVRFVKPGTLATCGTDGLVRIWDVSADGARAFDVTSQKLSRLRLSPDGTLLACTCDKEVAILNTVSGDVVWRLSLPDERFDKPAWSPMGDRIAVCCANSRSVAILDRDGQSVSSIAHGARPEEVAFSPDGSIVAIIGYERLQLCRADDGHEVFSRPVGTEGLSVAFSHDGTRLAYGGRIQGSTVIGLTTMQVLQELTCDSNVNCLVFSPDDSIIASGHGDSTIRLWEARTGQLQAELVGHERDVNTVAFSPDGHTLLSSANEGAVRAWSVDHGSGYGVVCRRLFPRENCWVRG